MSGPRGSAGFVTRPRPATGCQSGTRRRSLTRGRIGDEVSLRDDAALRDEVPLRDEAARRDDYDVSRTGLTRARSPAHSRTLPGEGGSGSQAST